MTDIAAFGYRIDSTDAVRAAGDLDRMNAAAGRADKGAVALEGSTGRLKKTLGGQGFRNFALQMNQVGQQTAATGNFMQALTIQLPDLLLGFGTIGIAIGALAPLMIGFGSALLGGAESAKDLEESVDALSEAFDNYQKTADAASMSTKALYENYGTASETLRSTLDLLNEIAAAELQQALDTTAQSLSELMGVRGDGEQRGAIADFFNVDIWFAIGSEARALRDTARQLTGEFLSAQYALADGAGNAEAQRDALVRMLAAAQALADADGERSAEELVIIKRLAESLKTAEQMVATTGDLAAGVGAAADEASRLAGNMATAAENAYAARQAFREFQDLQAIGPGNTLMPEGGGIDLLDLTIWGDRALPPGQIGNKPKRGGGGGGGGGSAVADARARDLEAFIASLQTERETLEAWRVEQLDLLAQFNDAELAAIGGHEEAKLRIMQEYQERTNELKQADRDRTLSVYGDLFGNMAALAQQGGRQTFAAWKAFSIAQATIDSYRAYTQVLADPFFIGRPFLRQVAAASTLAAGLAQVSSIASTQFGSGGGGSSSAPSGASSSTVAAEPERVVRISVQGEQWMKDMVEGLVTQIYEASSDGARVIVSR